jgi:hypothetical protein
MSIATANGIATALVGIAAVVIPFVLKRPREPVFSLSDEIELAAGPRSSLRTFLGVSFLLVLFGFMTYAAFESDDPTKYQTVGFTSFVMLCGLAAVMPKGRLYRLCIRLLVLYLVAFGIVICICGLSNIWMVATTGQASLLRRTGTKVSFEEAPFHYWTAVAMYGIFVAVALAGLREYFTRVYERHVSKAKTSSTQSINKDAS